MALTDRGRRRLGRLQIRHPRWSIPTARWTNGIAGSRGSGAGLWVGRLTCKMGRAMEGALGGLIQSGERKGDGMGARLRVAQPNGGEEGGSWSSGAWGSRGDTPWCEWRGGSAACNGTVCGMAEEQGRPTGGPTCCNSEFSFFHRVQI
jgi:hypothetical protein